MFLHHSKFESKSSLGRLHARYDRGLLWSRSWSLSSTRYFCKFFYVFYYHGLLPAATLCNNCARDGVFKWLNDVHELEPSSNYIHLQMNLLSLWQFVHIIIQLIQHRSDSTIIVFWLQARAPPMTNVMCRTNIDSFIFLWKTFFCGCENI